MSVTSKFAVVVWVRHGEGFDALWADLLSAAHKDPDPGVERTGDTVFMSWGFDTARDALILAGSLVRLSHRPEIVFLRLADYRREENSITFKDTRFAGS